MPSDSWAAEAKTTVARAQVLVAFQNEKSLLLEKFPKHVTELPMALEKMDCGNKHGKMSWEVFSAGLMEALKKQEEKMYRAS